MKLTPAETKVFDLIAYGLTSKQIADTLGCSFRTVNVHRSSIMNKTKANNVGILTRMSIMKKVRARINAIEKSVMLGNASEALTEIRNIKAFLGDKR